MVSNAFKNKTVEFGQKRPLHGRYTRAGIFVRWGMAVAYSRYKFVTVSLMKRLYNGRFTSETTARRLRKRNRRLNPDVLKNNVR
jgi:hypothetical protein